MYELWKAEVGKPLRRVGEYESLDTCWGWFLHALRRAKDLGSGEFIELRRPDGSAFAHCTMQLDANPDLGHTT